MSRFPDEWVFAATAGNAGIPLAISVPLQDAKVRRVITHIEAVYKTFGGSPITTNGFNVVDSLAGTLFSWIALVAATGASDTAVDSVDVDGVWMGAPGGAVTAAFGGIATGGWVQSILLRGYDL